MKAKFSTIEKTLIYGVVAVLLFFGVITLAVFHSSKKFMTNFTKNQVLNLTARSQEEFLTQYIKDLEAAFQYSFEKIDPDDVSKFINLNRYTSEWKELMKLNSNIYMAFFANEQGLLHHSSDWCPPSEFDPRLRPWYAPAKATPDKTHTRYYSSDSSGKDLFSISRAVLNRHNQVVGVFAIDMTIESLQKRLKKINKNSILKTYVINKKQLIFSDQYTNQPIASLPTPERKYINSLLLNGSRMICNGHENSFWVKQQLKFPSDWVLVINLKSTYVENKINKIVTLTCILIIIQLLVGITFARFVLGVFRKQVSNIHDTLAASLATMKGEKHFKKLPPGEELYHGIYSQISEHNRELKKTRKQVDTDFLTKSYSRQAYHKDMRRLLEAGQQFYHIIFDFDNFKIINDTLGHTTGDALLRYFSSYIIANTREGDKLYRYGGDEFILVCTGTDKRRVEGRITTLLSGFTRQIYKDLQVDVSVSAGIALYSGDEELAELIDACDTELYQSKREKKNK